MQCETRQITVDQFGHLEFDGEPRNSLSEDDSCDVALAVSLV